MKRCLFAVAAVVLASGCLVSPYPRSRTQTVVVRDRQPACHPSQYWDGYQCRHKGNGWGARKHDGEGRGHGRGND